MIEEILDEREMAFLKELEKHENRWVAIIESDGAKIVVGSGKDAVEAMEEAEAKGFGDAFLLKVQPFDRGYIPLTH
jgi:alkanesulfonate monooxygenase SsuD/methylene tetrahydromethanopterin reductase-like flavin-dependent oxidoreductase (luciferase family)